MYFDSFDICEAYALFHCAWNKNGYATGRPEKFHAETNSDIAVRLSRMEWQPGARFDYRRRALTENGRAIYDALSKRKEREFLRQAGRRQVRS